MKQDLLKLKAELLAQTSRDTEQAIYLGSWQESIPGWIFKDPVLDSFARNVYCVIKIGTKKAGVADFPDYKTLLKTANIGSRSTIARSLHILRLSRWIVKIESPRDDSGRFKKPVYILGDEPFPIEDLVLLDDGYFDYVQKQANTFIYPMIRKLASFILEEIKNLLEKNRAFTQDEKTSILSQRYDEHQSGKSKKNFFGWKFAEKYHKLNKEEGEDVYRELPAIPGIAEPSTLPSTPPVPGPSTGGVLGGIIKQNQQVSASNGVVGLKSVDKYSSNRSYKTETGSSCSSGYINNINKKTTTTTTKDTKNIFSETIA